MSLSTKAIPMDKQISSMTVSNLKKDATINKERQETNTKKMEIESERNVKKEGEEVACKVDAKNISLEPKVIKVEEPQRFPLKKNDAKKATDVVSKVSAENATTQTEAAVKYKMTPIITKTNAQETSKVAVPCKRPPMSTPFLGQRPLVLATHLVPSLPLKLFEVLVEAIEVATETPVVLLHEPRNDRPVAKGVTDIAILPASENWEEGVLLPVSFCFEHHLNKDDSPCVYVDVVVAADCAQRIEDITDLRGHRCSVPDRRKQIGAAALLFNHLYNRGESPSFFGDTLDVNTQIAALQMVAGKQAVVGVMESPVIKCHKNTLPGVDSLHILTSLGPLPPYRIMGNKNLSDVLVRKITAYLLNMDQDKEWVERFAPFGVKSFAKNSADLYDLSDIKSVVTSVPYY